MSFSPLADPELNGGTMDGCTFFRVKKQIRKKKNWHIVFTILANVERKRSAFYISFFKIHY